jgi:phenylalanyl-tRNA synthetase beta chain
MKVLVSWLNDYIETGLKAEAIAKILSDLGLPYEGIEERNDDAVIDVEVTSNRGDCLGYIGIARELAAATGKQLKVPVVELDESEKGAAEYCRVEVAEPELCGRYTARIIEGVRVGPSPAQIRERLEAVGLRSVNNVVDATNYAMMETGQPPHAFDYDKIAEGKIIVRKALAGEQIVSIDGTKCRLEADMLIIADPNGPVAVAGVMGGLATEVSETTTKILLEDAHFWPVSVRNTSRKLGLPSEASFRFERTVDIEAIDWASRRTCQLITQVAGGRIAKGVVDVYPEKRQAVQATLRMSRLKKLLGIEIATDEAVKILSALYFAPRLDGDKIFCSAPSWRSDVSREADLIEEVARVHGHNGIPTEQKIEIRVAAVDARRKMLNDIGTYLNGCGFFETITVGFVDEAAAALFAGEDQKEHMSVQDYAKKSSNLLRRSLLPSLMGVFKTNVNARNLPCRIFEIADTFEPTEKGRLPVEKARLALVCDGDLRDLRGVIEGLVKRSDRNAEVVLKPVDVAWAAVGAEVLVSGISFGFAGIICEKVAEAFDLKDTCAAAAELDFESLRSLEKGPMKVKPIPKFPAIQRDLSLIVDEPVTWAQIIDAIGKVSSEQLEEIRFVGTYRGKSIPSGKKSVTVSLRFRDEDGTLTHETVDGFEKAIMQNLAESVGAQLRTV